MKKIIYKVCSEFELSPCWFFSQSAYFLLPFSSENPGFLYIPILKRTKTDHIEREVKHPFTQAIFVVLWIAKLKSQNRACKPPAILPPLYRQSFEGLKLDATQSATKIELQDKNRLCRRGFKTIEACLMSYSIFTLLQKHLTFQLKNSTLMT